jgi:hypothetical protein
MDSTGAPRVSVIVRTKDRPQLLREALESLRAQTFRDFEVLVVNDGGARPDLPGEGVAASVRVLDTQPPHGRTRALNTGLRAARGRFVAYLDDDDVYLPPHLALLERFLAGSDTYRAAYTQVRVVLQSLGGDGRYGDERTIDTYDRPFNAPRLLSSNTIPLIGLMHDRELALAIDGFDESFDLFEDWDFLIRLSDRTRFHPIPEVTAIYRLRGDGSNATTEVPWRSPRSEEARRQILRKHWARHTPETQVALVDAFVAEKERACSDVDALRSGQKRAAEEAGRLTRERDEAREEAMLVRADAARQLQAAGERETALAAEAARVPELVKTLDAVHRSLAWRLFTPWWKFKAFLER